MNDYGRTKYQSCSAVSIAAPFLNVLIPIKDFRAARSQVFSLPFAYLIDFGFSGLFVCFAFWLSSLDLQL